MTAPREDVQAVAKFVRVSPRKARLVADHIRGRSVPEARAILAFTPRAAAREVEKVLRSAVANAESNPNRHWNGDDLYVKAVFVDEGSSGSGTASVVGPSPATGSRNTSSSRSG